jgi:hypothetical protein
MPVPWRVPADQAYAESAWIARFARYWHAPESANALTATETWLGAWLAANVTGRDSGFVLLPLLCAAVLGAGLLARPRAKVIPALWSVGSAASLSLAFWFMTAPRPSLAIGPAWLLSAAVTTGFLVRSGAAHMTRLAIGMAGLLTLVVACNTVRVRGSLVAPATWRAALLTWPDPNDWFREAPDPDVEAYVTRNGLAVNVPVRRNLCRRAPLPCTPHPAHNLRLRAPGELRRGFIIDGDWQPLRWPNPASRFLEWWRTSRAR